MLSHGLGLLGQLPDWSYVLDIVAYGLSRVEILLARFVLLLLAEVLVCRHLIHLNLVLCSDVACPL